MYIDIIVERTWRDVSITNYIIICIKYVRIKTATTTVAAA